MAFHCPVPIPFAGESPSMATPIPSTPSGKPARLPITCRANIPPAKFPHNSSTKLKYFIICTRLDSVRAGPRKMAAEAQCRHDDAQAESAGFQAPGPTGSRTGPHAGYLRPTTRPPEGRHSTLETHRKRKRYDRRANPRDFRVTLQHCAPREFGPLPKWDKQHAADRKRCGAATSAPPASSRIAASPLLGGRNARSRHHARAIGVKRGQSWQERHW